MIAGIILAGSHVWRDDALDSLCPRLLLPVANTPLVAYLLAWLRDGGVEAVTICANQCTRPVQTVLRDGGCEDLDLYYYEDRVPRGPAGCLRDAALISDADLFVVAEASVIPGVDLGPLVQWHRQSNAAASVVVTRQTGGNVEGEAWLEPAGIYVFGRGALEAVPATGFQDIKEGLVPRLHRGGLRVEAYPVDRPALRVRGLGSYFEAQASILARLCARELNAPGYEWRDAACAHRSARIASQTRIVGPVMVGPRSRIGERAIVIGPTVIGEDCVLGHGAAVAHSVLWDRCWVEDHAVVDHCLATTGVRFRSGEVRHGETCVAEPDRPRPGLRAPRVRT